MEEVCNWVVGFAVSKDSPFPGDVLCLLLVAQGGSSQLLLQCNACLPAAVPHSRMVMSFNPLKMEAPNDLFVMAPYHSNGKTT